MNLVFVDIFNTIFYVKCFTAHYCIAVINIIIYIHAINIIIL